MDDHYASSQEKAILLLTKFTDEKGHYVLTETTKTGETFSWQCPKCRSIHTSCLSQPGTIGLTCTNCNARSFITAVGQRPQPQQQPRQGWSAATPANDADDGTILPGDADDGTILPSDADDGTILPGDADDGTILPGDADDGTILPGDEPETMLDPGRLQPTDEQDHTVIESIKGTSTPPPCVYGPPPTPYDQGLGNSPAELSWGGMFRRTTVRLPLGSTIVGRNDPQALSDVNIDDPEVSRRSVRIDAVPSGTDCAYSLTLLRTTNPVTVGGRQVAEGQTVALHYDQVITLGSTTIKFRKAKR